MKDDNLEQQELKKELPAAAVNEAQLPAETEYGQAAADRAGGLSEEEAMRRLSDGLSNVQVNPDEVTLKDIIRENVCTFFNLIFLVIAVFLCVVGSFRNLTFLPVIISNTLIGIIQEWRAKKQLDALSIMNAPKTKVIRDGRERLIDSSSLVLGDLVVFEAGSQVSADAVIAEGVVQVNEALLTGEADEITKSENDHLFSGSFIMSGRCTARLEKVGKDSYVSQLTLQAKKRQKKEQSEMIRSLDRLVKAVGILIVPIAVVLFVQQFHFRHQPLSYAVTSTAAAIIGMIPEGLYLLASVAMAVSAMRLARSKVLVHSMKSIETLARVDVLCVDKTGTITEETMTVEDLVPLSAHTKGRENTLQVPAVETLTETAAAFSPQESAGQENPAGENALPEGAAQSQKEQAMASGDTPSGAPLSDSDEQADFRRLELLIGDFAACQNPDNATMRAVRRRFRENTGRRAEKVISFSSRYKYSGVVFPDQSYVLGAPEYLLRENYKKYAAEIEEFTVKGYRTLLFARYEGEITGGALSGEVTPLALIILMNPVRENAPEIFSYFEKQGVKVKVISGDNPRTVSEVALKAGIEDSGSYVDVSALTEEELEAAAEKYTVFGRVSPEQKRLLLSAMRKAGHTVAMTGDGVNDVLAMKEADCSIAMASGSDAASQAAQMVLIESDFSKLPSIVNEGRRVVNNIERTASLFLVKNIFSFLLSVFSILFMVNYPLEPSQVSLISMFTIGIPAFLMSLERNRDRIQGRFLSNVMFKALPAGLTDFAVISLLVVFCQEFRVGGRDLSTSCTILLAIVGIMILYRIAQPMTIFHWVLWISMICGIVVSMIFFNQIFAISMLSRKSAMLLLIFAIITEPCLRYTSILTALIWKFFRSVKARWIRYKESGGL